MKMNRLYSVMMIGATLLLGSCAKDAEAVSEVQPEDIETTEAFAPMTFEQTRALVGEVLGQDVAERIEPTGRYVRILHAGTCGAVARTTVR